jgi:hypothetical protein
MSVHEIVALVRDIFIILLSLTGLVVVALLAWLILEVRGLLRFLRDELKPIIASAQDTVSTVRGTTSFVSKSVVEPVVKVSSYVAGVRAVFDTVLGRDRSKS